MSKKKWIIGLSVSFIAIISFLLFIPVQNGIPFNSWEIGRSYYFGDAWKDVSVSESLPVVFIYWRIGDKSTYYRSLNNNIYFDEYSHPSGEGLIPKSGGAIHRFHSVKNVHKSSFEVIGGIFARDKYKYYCKGEYLRIDDEESFKYLGGSRAEDNLNYYTNCKKTIKE